VKRIFDWFLFALFLPFWPVFWLDCRVRAKVCPKCLEKWHTELVGEWDGEHWKCRSCGHYWEVPYKT